ncbi:transposase [Streptomyces sp. NPDC005728]|uniref:transposase n=1 Tax=Streptomyces sp. NPDC005728 TaxID=3157054 RepID=UPI0033C54850
MSWFVSFLVDDSMVTPKRHAMPDTAVGIDRGVKTAAVTSDGDFHDRSFITPGEAVRYRRLQHKLARSQRGSANRAKTIAAMGRIMSRVTDRRTDFCAQSAARIVAKNALVVLEDLRIKNMSASAAGMLAGPPGRAEAGDEPGHPRQGMAPPRSRPRQCGPVHGHARGEGQSCVHLAAVFRLRLRHREQP